ncbi:MAG: tetratricopeptide repeat protein, partial [Chitinophagales bacterium]
GMENTEWARVVLGDLFFENGQFNAAKQIYAAALQYRGEYAPALAGMAKLEIRSANYEAAIELLKKCVSNSSEAHYVSLLADAYFLSGDIKKSEEI